jgi:hypothetical protein
LITPDSPVHNFDFVERTDFLTGVKFGWKLIHQRGQFWMAFNSLECGTTTLLLRMC